MKPVDVCIVGAGITGLATAIALRGQGHRVAVYERFALSKPLGSGLMLQPTGLAALERLGLRRDIESRGARITRLFGDTTSRQVVFNLDYRDLDSRHYAIGIHRAALHGVLWRAFERCGAALEVNKEIAGWEPD
ncbi:MAG: FAD-dependent oxidoreductase, partial [Alphaproteobacteria bacterium]|nr:FAD-dependent oxidoreductase [Alphaproteobacteria bacterium]